MFVWQHMEQASRQQRGSLVNPRADEMFSTVELARLMNLWGYVTTGSTYQQCDFDLGSARLIVANVSQWEEYQQEYPERAELSEGLWMYVEQQWRLMQEGYSAALEQSVASRLATGNGFQGSRATLEWSNPEPHSGLLIAGLFDTITQEWDANQAEPMPALVALPDGHSFRIQVDGQYIDLRQGALVSLHRWVDWRQGLYMVDWQHATPAGPSVRIRLLRCSSLQDRSLSLQAVEISPGQPAELTLELLPQVPGDHLLAEQAGGNMLSWRTAHRDQWVAEAHRETVSWRGSDLPQWDSRRFWTWFAAAGEPATFLQFISRTKQQSQQETAAEVGSRAVAQLQRAWKDGPQSLLAGHINRWAERWAESDVVIRGDALAQRALRFALYHLISAANPEDERVSIGARGLTGQGYLGHVFWDTEIFMLPFYIFTWPEAARSLLMYRYHTLPAARQKAARLGYRGALYAWESADTGDEATPLYVAFPDGTKVPVAAGLEEHHVSADIAYAVWQYFKATGDCAFLLGAGAEIILETARFWASRAVEDQERRFHIRKVVGPDEYHDGVDDNAFTNEMARWNIKQGLEVASILGRRWRKRWQELSHELDLLPTELAEWREVADRLVAPRADGGDLINQFAGFLQLDEFDLRQVPKQSPPVDVLLGPERTRHSQVIKQADVVQMLALLWDRFSPSEREASFNYYEPRCAHGSSLSPATHALVAARLGKLDLAYEYFLQSAMIDLQDSAPNSAPGIHLGSLGGLWQAVTIGFLGLSLEERGLRLDPHLPAEWTSISLPLRWRDRRIRLRVQNSPLTLSATLEEGGPFTLYLGKQSLHRLRRGETATCRWDDRRQAWSAGS
jgi:kojibiose phosphorylase